MAKPKNGLSASRNKPVPPSSPLIGTVVEVAAVAVEAAIVKPMAVWSAVVVEDADLEMTWTAVVVENANLTLMTPSTAKCQSIILKTARGGG